MNRRALPALIVLLAYAASAPSGGTVHATPQAPRALAGLTRVAISSEIQPSIDGLAPADLSERLAQRLTRTDPPIAIDASAPARLRLIVSVQAHGATALRGFWLPFSGRYAIGVVRLTLERAARVDSVSPSVIVIVWQTEQVIAAPWRTAADEVRRAADTLTDAFSAARRQAR